jgi:hypothetical protein
MPSQFLAKGLSANAVASGLIKPSATIFKSDVFCFLPTPNLNPNVQIKELIRYKNLS